MKPLLLTVALVATLAACRSNEASTQPEHASSAQAVSDALPEIRYYEIADT